jgi:hypothetical protein
VVFNEIAWAGTGASSYGEWIELYNYGSSVVNLDGWAILEVRPDGTQVTVIQLSGSVGPRAYYLIERVTPSSPDPIQDVQADISGSFGGSGLSNSGEYLLLADLNDGTVVDGLDCSSDWFAGSSVGRLSMERVNATSPGTSDNWATNDMVTQNGLDANGSAVNGTPRASNSAKL